MSNHSIQVDATAGAEALAGLAETIAKFAADEAKPGDVVIATVLLPEGAEQTEAFSADVTKEHILARFTPKPAETPEPIKGEEVDLGTGVELPELTEEQKADVAVGETAEAEPEAKKKKSK